MPALDEPTQNIATITESIGRYANRVNGEVVSAVFSEAVVITAGDKYCSYLQNVGKVAVDIVGLTVVSLLASKYRLDKVTGTAGGGGTARILSSKRTFLGAGQVKVEVQQDPEITGLTAQGDGLDIMGVIAAGEITHDYEIPFILDPNEAVALFIYEFTTVSGIFHVMQHVEG